MEGFSISAILVEGQVATLEYMKYTCTREGKGVITANKDGTKHTFIALQRRMMLQYSTSDLPCRGLEVDCEVWITCLSQRHKEECIYTPTCEKEDMIHLFVCNYISISFEGFSIVQYPRYKYSCIGVRKCRR